MRKASYIIALSLITVFLTGHFFIYKSVLNSHKKAFKTYIRSNFDNTEEIEISPSELYTSNNNITWLDENKEVMFNGIMYDIVSIKNIGAKVVLCVVNDKDEKELMNRYQKEFNAYENGNAGKQNTNLIKDFLALKYFQKAYSNILVFGKDFNPLFNQQFLTSSGYLNSLLLPPIG